MESVKPYRLDADRFIEVVAIWQDSVETIIKASREVLADPKGISIESIMVATIDSIMAANKILTEDLKGIDR